MSSGASTCLTLTQEWLATSDDAEALSSSGYWHPRRHEQPHVAVDDTRFQALPLTELARVTGTTLAA